MRKLTIKIHFIKDIPEPEVKEHILIRYDSIETTNYPPVRQVKRLLTDEETKFTERLYIRQ